MLSAFTTYINEKSLCTPESKILVALSGGADSVVLLHLFIKAGYSVAAAHCNFKLRIPDADNDETFVTDLCKRFNVQLFKTSFDTKIYAKQNKLSVEMAARELRYNWFDELAGEHHFDAIATGHHINDSIETLLLNLARGTGLSGISGVPVKNGRVIRPLLFATRQEIENYLTEEGIDYCTDKSNNSLEYMRNLIRHNVVPELKKINPDFEQVMHRNMNYFADAQQLVNQRVNEIQKDVQKAEGQRLIIDSNRLKKYRPLETILFELLQPYEFNSALINQIVTAIDAGPGKVFYSATHQLLIDREQIIIEKIADSTEARQFYSIDDINSDNINMFAQIIAINDFKLEKSPMVAQFDADKILFPLTFRAWEAGDYFYPLGMNQRKKLSDFFIDQKVDRFKKERIKVLVSGDHIIWIPGYRIDNRYKVGPGTKEILKIIMK